MFLIMYTQYSNEVKNCLVGSLFPSAVDPAVQQGTRDGRRPMKDFFLLQKAWLLSVRLP